MTTEGQIDTTPGVLVAVRSIEIFADDHETIIGTQIVVDPINLTNPDDVLINNKKSAEHWIRNNEIINIVLDTKCTIAETDRRLFEAKKLTLGEKTEGGYYVVESVWAGGLKENGIEFRFYPVL